MRGLTPPSPADGRGVKSNSFSALAQTPIAMSKTPVRFRNITPQHGEHTEPVLQDHGYSWEEIKRLRDKGVI